jgi:hypothetical protein
MYRPAERNPGAMTITDQRISPDERTDHEPHNQAGPVHTGANRQTLSRRTALRRAAISAAGTLAIGSGSRNLVQTVSAEATTAHQKAASGMDPRPKDAVASILAAMDRFPLLPSENATCCRRCTISLSPCS